MNQIVNQTFNAPASSLLAGQDAGDELSGGITGGYGLIRYRGKVWSIHYRQQETTIMRDDGDGPKGSIEVIILKANPNLSKTWYENGFDENNSAPPDCASANGVVPDQGVPKRQSNACLNCPRNQWNTASNGGKGKACGDHRRLAVVPMGDPVNESLGGPMLLRCPAASLQDMAAFDQRYKQQGYPYFSLAVKISFDHKESYPKFVFEAIRPLTDDEARIVLQHRASFEVARVISEAGPGVAAQPQAEAGATFLAGPASGPSALLAGAAAQPVAQPAPAQPQATAQPAAAQPAPQQPVQQAAPQAAPQAQRTGFGTAAPVTAAPQAQPQARPAVIQARPAVAMTGFGGSAPAQAQPQAAPVDAVQPVQQEVIQPTQAQPAPGGFDDSLDSKLADLLK